MTLDEALVAVAQLGVRWARTPNDDGGDVLLSFLRADRPDGGSLVVAAVILAPADGSPAGGWMVGLACRPARAARPPTGPTIVLHTDQGVVTWPLGSTVIDEESLLEGVRYALEAAAATVQGWTLAMQRRFERGAASC